MNNEKQQVFGCRTTYPFMKGISLRPDVTIKNQIDFLENNGKFVSNAIYGYMFEDLTLREIESKYLGVDAQGFYAKTVLNCVGLDTSSRGPNNNKGIYNASELDQVISALVSDSDPMLNGIGRLLQKV